ncbi:isopenicillin N synthase-like dioxygenase [Streptomyces griseochromogenes]|uniref:Isopenicillin N synthase-like dioxygenase n=1 Tax=Streptomyces griseochromogenes TaxID=68214 RepID=A0A1B1B2J8_9ACTN|nr:2-oxoglutarate and iron-dependent oxygenase domain-containing protein [Streptomyces griseochromogenes]ANP53055.1 oxidoreductase [Streptomyces griseochromogenes]MBP2047736.1 isopenicillin N synthase-like dioxygenase [Streptomyces griseochromogenes]
MSITFPVLDLRDADRGPAARAAFLKELRAAVHDIGFFQLVGHGVEGADEILDLARSFFSLPDSELDELSILKSPHFRGYSEVGRELTKGAPDRRSQLDVGPEREATVPGPDDPPYLWLAGPNMWPASMPELKPAINRWMSELTDVSHRLLRLILAALDAPEDFLDPVVKADPQVHFKLLHYPGRPDGRPQDDQGIGTHKDYGLLTLLLQDAFGGLQVSVDEGEFLDVPPVPGAFVVNLGELLEVATRGYLRATTHRVVSPPPGVRRYSAPFFYNPRLDATMLPLPTREVREAGGVVQDPDSPLSDSYGNNVMRGMLRAFPDVIAEQHPELLDDPVR